MSVFLVEKKHSCLSAFLLGEKHCFQGRVCDLELELFSIALITVMADDKCCVEASSASTCWHF